jgi:HSP20 family protein
MQAEFLARFMHLPVLVKTNDRKENQAMKNNCDSSAALATRAENGSGFGFLINELDRLFDFPAPTVSSRDWNPVSAHETESGYRYDLELPGLKKDELKVTLTDGVLAVRGQKRLFRDGAETSVEVERSLLVPEDVDPEKIQARYVDGVLTLEISKHEEAKPKTIQVQVA